MRLAIIGVTGLVGETLLRVIDERAIPISALGAFASRDRSEPLVFRGASWPVRAATANALREGRFDAVFFASSDDAGAELAESCVGSGAVVIDNSATFRLCPEVPLIVPEVNGAAVRAGQRIFPVANCTAILLCVALAPVVRAAGLCSVRVATYQAVSGAGRAGFEALAREERTALGAVCDDSTGSPRGGRPTVFPAPIFHNVIPQIGDVDDAGVTGEERKLAAETRKILSLPGLRVAATTVRVPVLRSHAEVVFFETARDTSTAELAREFSTAEGVVFYRNGIVTPRDAEGDDRVHVARLRAEDGSQRHFQLWLVGDQLRKGAATNAVQILELLIRERLLARENAFAP